jgi:hypothetical protein
MGKIILEFDSFEEQEEARMAIDGGKYKLVIWNLDQHLRSEMKYNDNLDEKVYDEFEQLRNKLRQLLGDQGLTMD